MAERGGQPGNTNAVRGRRWSQAVERAMDAYPNKPVSLEVNKGLDEAAWEFVTELMTKKDLGFFKEFGDRVEGKPAQAIFGGGDNGEFEITQKITREVIRP